MKSILSEVVPAGGSSAILVQMGQHVRIVNTRGSQVVDTWAFRTDDPDEFMSMDHSRPALLTVRPRVGHRFVSNRRRPIVTFVADSSPGVHDMTMPPCDGELYRQLGAPSHANCKDNLAAALARHAIERVWTPAPLNLFQNSPIHPDLSYSFEPSLAMPGDYVELSAEIPLLFVFSACPMDINPINGHAVSDIEVIVLA
jgi:uncharacterized protein YcgI (DUF1989 family)